MPILIFFAAHWYLSLFCQTFFQHRYGAHGAFRMSKGWEKFFFLFTVFVQGSSYLSPRAYAIMHRMHHAFTDTDKDPHSPSFSSNVFDMMWKTKNAYSTIFDGTMEVEERFLKNVPTWQAVDKFAHGWFYRLLWVGIYVAFYVHFATSPWWYLLLPIQIVMGPFHGMVINWFAHKYGYRNFKMKNTSENLFSVDLLMLGEAYHNNHHKRASSINFGYRWHELDPIYFVILFFKWVGIVQVDKPRVIPIDAENHPHLESRLEQMETEESVF
jgi:stearoyl-CoA desaturase (delta-9 desaturase)